MSTKKMIKDLAMDDVVDFATAPPFWNEGNPVNSLSERYAFGFGKVEGMGPSDDSDDPRFYVDFEDWGEHAFLPEDEVDVLTEQEASDKLVALHQHFDSWPTDGWANTNDEKRGWHPPKTIQITYTHSYGEPGYTDPKRAILFGNWNYVSKEVQAWLESNGFELEWEDEWTVLDNGKAYRTSPTSYDWTRSFVTDDEGNDYTQDDHDGLIEAFAMTDKGHQPHLLPVWITDDELKAEGFTLADPVERESGFHAGQNDTPEKDAVPLFEKGAEAVVFRHTEQSQFYIKWDVWVKWPDGQEVGVDTDGNAICWNAEEKTTYNSGEPPHQL